MKKITLLIAFYLSLVTMGYGQSAIEYRTSTTIGTYTELTTPTVLGSSSTNNGATSLDDVMYRVSFPAGYSFSYLGVARTDVNIDTNGFIGFATVAWTSDNYTPLSANPVGGTTSGIISAFGADLNAFSSATANPGNISWKVEGTGTDEVFVVQYKNFKPFENAATLGRLLNFQIRLYESTHATKPNHIEIVYGNCVTGTSTATNVDIGIRGATGWAANVSSLMNDNVPSGTTCTWADAVVGNNDTNGNYFSSANTAITIPNGLTYTWAPQTGVFPVRTFTAATAITTAGATVNWTAPTGATQYNVQYKLPGSCTWTNWSGNPVMTNSVVITGLASFTSYQVRVQSSNGTLTSIWSHIPNAAGTGNGYTATGSFTTLATCIAPTAPAVTNVQATSATLGWTASTSVPTGGYDYYVSTSSTAPTAATTPTGSVAAGVVTANLTPLAANTQHYVWVRANCGSGDFSVWTSSINFTTPPTCVAPTAPVISAVLSNGATLGWTASTSAPSGGYQYYVATTSTAPTAATTPTGTVGAGVTTASLGSLNPTTQYYVWVRANCGSGDFSAWTSSINFTTTQVAGTLPYTEDFETAGPWGIVNGSQTNKFYIGTATNNGGTKSLYISNDSGTTNTYTLTSSSTVQAYRDILLPPSIIEAKLSFDVRVPGEFDASNNYDYLRVWIVPTTFVPTAGTQISSGTGRIQVGGSLLNLATFTNVSYIIPAAAYAGQTVRLVFEWRNDSSDGTQPPAAIDNINITQVTCIAPSAVTSLVVPGTVNVSWTAPVTGVPGSGYDYYVSTTNTAPTAATTPTGNVPGGTVALTTLPADTVHYIWVRSKCSGSDLSVWTNSFTFRTDCAPGAPSQTIENFESYTGAMPDPTCWREATGALSVTPAALTGTTAAWTNENFGNAAGANGKAARIELYGTKNDWIISPAFNLGADATDYQLEFSTQVIPWTGTATVTDMGEKYVKVVISTDGGATWSDANVLKTYNNSLIPSAVTNQVISLAAYSGNVKIGFYAFSTSTAQDLRFYIDNFRIREIPSCAGPTALTLGTVTKNAATVTWTASTSAPTGGYQYYLSTTNTAPTAATTATGTVAAGVLTATATVIPDTQYYIWVKSDCGSGLQSEWVGPIAFKSLCNYGDITGTTPVSRCGAGSVSLAATASAGTLKWYEAATGGTAVATGSPFVTNVTADKTYYVTSESVGSPTPGGGRVAPPAGTTAGTTPSEYGLVFNATSTFTLNSVDVFLNSATAGDLTVTLKNNAGTQLQTITVPVPAGSTTAPVQFTVNLGWNIPVGTGYRLLAMSGPGMVRESALGGYPYAVGSVASITDGYILGTSTAYYFFYNWNYTGTCAGPRTAVTATVSAPPAFTLSGNPPAVCVGQTTAAVTIATGAANYDTFVWTPSTGVSGNGTTGWTFNPAVSTTYSLQASQSGGTLCNAAPVTVNVTINPLPSAIVLADATICEGGAAVQLTPTGGTTTVTLLSEGFNAATNAWTKINNSTGGTVANAAWTLRPDGLNTTAVGAPATTWHSNDNSQFYMTNSDSQGSATTLTSTILSSPSFSTLGLPSASISFYHYFYEPAATGATGKVEVSLDNSTWVTLQTYNATTGEGANFAAATVALTAPYLNQATVYIRFKYDGVWRYYWGIDNVTVSGQLPANFTWSPVTALYTDAAATTAYVAGTPAATVYAKPTANTTYTVTATNASGCINTDTSLVTFSSVAAPTVPASTQEFCNAGTVADLVATGTGIKWYAGSTGGTALAPTTALVNNTQYFASQTVGGCESVVRIGRTAIINVVAAPAVANANPVFCNAATVADLVPGGANIKWYAGSTGGTALTATTALVSGTPYYASQTVNGCEGLLRATVTPTINVVAAPAISNNAQVFCNNATVADLLPNGPEIKWYIGTVGGTALATTTALVSGTPYYASQTVNGCEGLLRGMVTATVLVTPAPAVNDVDQVFCNAATVADLLPNDASIKWYAGSTGGMPLASTEVLISGTPYYASQTIDGCEGLLRTEVGVTINVTPAPVVDDTDQVFCNAATVADLLPNDASITWYAGSTGGMPLASTEALVSGTPYYASQTIDGCEGLVRTEVGVTMNVTTAPTGDDEQEFCTSATVADLVATGDVITWYDAETDGTVLTGDIALTDGSVYYASQTIDGCEGLVRFGVTAVIHTVVADAPEDVNVCTEYVLPALTSGAYFTEAGGTGVEVAAGTAITETTTLYVYAQEGTDVVCSDENSFTVTVANIAAPTGDDTQVIEGSVGPDVTVADLQTDPVAGTVTWYASEEDALAGIDALADDTQLAQGATYYATQTVGECTSVEVFAVTVDIVLDRENFDIKAFTFHPNPVKDILNLSYSSDITSVTVFNLLGQKVISQQSHATDVKVDMSSLADGAYVVNVTSGNTVKTIKVIKKQ